MSITIGLAGDVMIGRLVNEALDNLPPEHIWGDMLPHLHATDLNLINLEAALTKQEKAVPKVFNFKADPEKVNSLVKGRIDVVNLANNHVLDYGKAGLIETLATLDKAGIAHVGAGRTIQEASSPAILIRNGVSIGVLGCTDNEPEWQATETEPGTRYLEVGDVDQLKDDIRHLRPKVDLLIVSIHWGPNMRQRPPAAFIAFAHQLVEWGVDILHGHSAHLFQGVEIYRGKCILYDTGDFVDDYYVDPHLCNDRSFFFVVTAEKGGPLSLQLIPVLIQNFQVNQAHGKDAEASLMRMQQLSEELYTQLVLEKNCLKGTCK